MERPNTTIWLVVGAIVLLFGVVAWFWLGRTPTPDIPAPTSTTTRPMPVPSPVQPPPPPPPPPQAPAKEAPMPVEAKKPVPSKTESVKKDVSRKESAAKKPVAAKVVKEPPPPPPAEPDPADRKTEKVFLTSRPSGAKVSLDGKALGKTPLEIEVRGKGRVVLVLDGYKPLEKEVRVADVRGTLNLELKADGGSSATGGNSGPMGKFFLSSSPAGAEILYQGKVIGKTPKMVELPAGNRTLNLRSGALQKSLDLEVREGQNPAHHVPL